MTSDQPCSHLLPDTYPLVVDAVLDAELGITDALVHCSACGRHYFLEMLDMQGSARLFRIRNVSLKAGAALLRDLDRGSCDLNRAAEETRHVRLASPLSKSLLLIDSLGPVIVEVVAAPDDLPSAGWRELACDGSRIDELNGQPRE